MQELMHWRGWNNGEIENVQCSDLKLLCLICYFDIKCINRQFGTFYFWPSNRFTQINTVYLKNLQIKLTIEGEKWPTANRLFEIDFQNIKHMKGIIEWLKINIGWNYFWIFGQNEAVIWDEETIRQLAH